MIVRVTAGNLAEIQSHRQRIGRHGLRARRLTEREAAPPSALVSYAPQAGAFRDAWFGFEGR